MKTIRKWDLDGFKGGKPSKEKAKNKTFTMYPSTEESLIFLARQSNLSCSAYIDYLITKEFYGVEVNNT